MLHGTQVFWRVAKCTFFYRWVTVQHLAQWLRDKVLVIFMDAAVVRVRAECEDFTSSQICFTTARSILMAMSCWAFFSALKL
jgi:hypothetical protein